MDVHCYCDEMYSEMTTIRSRLYVIMRELMAMSDEQREKVSADLTEMNRLADELGQKLDNLKMECPADWSPQRESIEETRRRLKEKINYWDEAHIPAGYYD